MRKRFAIFLVAWLSGALYAEGTWEQAAMLPTARQEVGVAVVSGKIYVIGGFNAQGQSVNTVERFDPTINQWETVDDLPAPSPLNHVGAAGVNGKLFVIGGLRQNFSAVSSVYCYDPSVEEWTIKSDMPAARGAMGVGAIGDLIYAAGGLPGSRSNDFAVYDTALDEWTPLAAMPTPRDHLAAFAAEGKFYAVAGRFNGVLMNEVEVYDPATNGWAARTPIPTARGGIAAAVVSGLAYVFGGEGNVLDPNGIFNQAEEYNIAADEWRAVAPMPVGVHGIGAAALGGKIYIPGGGPLEGFGVTDLHQVFTPPAPNAAAHWMRYGH